MNERAEFFRAIEEDADNWDRYAVFSDWLEEHDERDLALAFRWCWANHQRPYYKDWDAPKGISMWLVTVMENNLIMHSDMRNWVGTKPPGHQTFEDAMNRISKGVELYIKYQSIPFLRFEPIYENLDVYSTEEIP